MSCIKRPCVPLLRVHTSPASMCLPFQAPWLLMIETDYVWLKPPLPPPAEDTRAPSWAFPFNYIVPDEPHLAPVMRKMFPSSRGPLSLIPGSGPAPVMLRMHEWAKVG